MIDAAELAGLRAQAICKDDSVILAIIDELENARVEINICDNGFKVAIQQRNTAIAERDHARALLREANEQMDGLQTLTQYQRNLRGRIYKHLSSHRGPPPHAERPDR